MLNFISRDLRGPFFAGLFLLAVGGCQPQGTSSQTASPGGSAQPAGKKKQIAAILMQDDQFYRLNELGMQRAAKERGAEMLTASANGALDKEINLVDTYVSRGVDAILVSPLSPSGSIPALKRAAAKGVKVITYDGKLESGIPVAAITSDQIALGATTGKTATAYIREKLGGKAKVAVIEFLSLSVGQGPLRPRGFKDELKKLPGAQIVAEQDAWLAPQAEKVVTDLLNAHPEINVIWAANEGGTVGAVTAVKNAGRAGKVVVFGTDMSEQIAGFLLSKDDILQAVTGQKPLEMGAEAVGTALNALEGKPVEKQKTLPGTLYKRGDEVLINAFKQTAAQATQ